MKKTTKKKGFTLIEILIVIALIGLLLGIVSITFQSSQQRSRDAKRKSDLQLVKKALENAKNDCQAGSYYPAYTNLANAVSYKFVNTYFKLLGYIDGDIQDPQFNPSTLANSYMIAYRPTASLVSNVCIDPSANTLTRQGSNTYLLRAKLEITSDPDSTNSYNKCQSIMSSLKIDNPSPSSGDGYYYVCPD